MYLSHKPDAMISILRMAAQKAQPVLGLPLQEGKPLLPHSQTLAWLIEMHSHFVMPVAIPGNSSKCTIKSQQLFQITAKKMDPAAILSEPRKHSKPAGRFLLPGWG